MIETEPGADVARVVRDSKRVLGDAHRASLANERSAVASLDTGERWSDASSVIEMSLEEARALAREHAEAAALAAGLDSDETRRLRALLEEELSAAFRRIQESGSEAQIEPELCAAAQRVLRRCESFLSREEIAALSEAASELFGGAEPSPR